MFWNNSRRLDLININLFTLIGLVKSIIIRGTDLMALLDDLKAAVAANTAAVQTVVAALEAARTNTVDPTELKAATDQITADTKTLTDAATPPAPPA